MAHTACPRCGVAVRAGDRYCAGCGRDVTGDQGMVPTAVAPTQTSLADRLDAALVDSLRRATNGSYDILNELGRGGMAVVYRARDLALDRDVAIKVMLPRAGLNREQSAAMMARFRQEARVAAKLSHLHIIPIYAVGESDDFMYFVMKCISGQSLESVIKQKGALSIGLVEEVLAQVAGALDHAHRHRVIHRDIKPSNIMIDGDGHAVVTDFGIAKEAEAQQSSTGTIIGTPDYMSPEQGAGKRLTGAADQYSLGVATYEMLTGRRPIEGDSIFELIHRHANVPPEPVERHRPDCPMHLRVIVQRMLEKNPEARFPTLKDVEIQVRRDRPAVDEAVRTELVTIAVEGAARQQELARRRLAPPSPGAETRTPDSAAVKPPPRTTPRGRRSGRTAQVAAAAIVLTVSTLGVWQLSQNSRTDRPPAGTPIPPAAVLSDSARARDSVTQPAATRSNEQKAAGQDEAARADSQPVSGAAVPPPPMGRVIVTGLPRGGEVRANGILQPGFDFELRPGPHRMELSAAGYRTDTVSLTVLAGRMQTVAFAGAALPAVSPPPPTAAAVPDSGVVVIVVDPRADISVNGTTAGYGRSFTIKLPAGTPARLRLLREGYTTLDTLVRARAHDTLQVTVRLIRRN